MTSVIAFMIAAGAFVVTVTALLRASRAHDWFWLGGILASWFLLGGWTGPGWLVAAIYLYLRRRSRVSDRS